MKKLLVILSLASSISAMATEFNVKMDRVTCSIKNNQVIRTEFVGKDQTEASVTEKREVSFTGIESLIEKAAETATDAPADEYFGVSMKHDGKVYKLHSEDSRESMTLIRLVGRTCR